MLFRYSSPSTLHAILQTSTLVVLLAASVSAQQVNWDGLTVSAKGEFSVPTLEFGEYWSNGPGAGIIAAVPLSDIFELSGAAGLAWYSAAETAKKSEIPQILMFRLEAGVTADVVTFGQTKAQLGGGLANHIFILLGPAARPGLDNAIESELGMFGSAAIKLGTPASFDPTFFVQIHTIFTGPERVGLWVIGVAFPL